MATGRPYGREDLDLRADLGERQGELVDDALELSGAHADAGLAPQRPGPRPGSSGVIDHDLEDGVVDLLLLRHPGDRVRVDQQGTGQADLVEGLAAHLDRAEVLHVTGTRDSLERDVRIPDAKALDGPPRRGSGLDVALALHPAYLDADLAQVVFAAHVVRERAGEVGAGHVHRPRDRQIVGGGPDVPLEGHAIGQLPARHALRERGDRREERR